MPPCLSCVSHPSIAAPPGSQGAVRRFRPTRGPGLAPLRCSGCRWAGPRFLSPQRDCSPANASTVFSHLHSLVCKTASVPESHLARGRVGGGSRGSGTQEGGPESLQEPGARAGLGTGTPKARASLAWPDLELPRRAATPVSDQCQAGAHTALERSHVNCSKRSSAPVTLCLTVPA